MNEKAKEIIAKHSARASTCYYSTEGLQEDITLALDVEYSRGWMDGQASMMPVIKASNAVCKRAVTKAEELESQQETFLAEHDENVRLHFENVELKTNLRLATDALEKVATCRDDDHSVLKLLGQIAHEAIEKIKETE